MKAKHIYSAALVALMAAACTNDDFTAVGNADLQGKKMDASNFTLVGTGVDEDAQTRVEQIPAYYANGSWHAETPTWESRDMVGFSHIYSDNEIITNYKFTIESGVGESTAATFRTDNSTIFEGGYFVYYPFDKNYADYEGIPFRLDAVQEQDASSNAIVTASMDPNTNTETKNKFLAAGKHLKKFSISDRVEAEPQVNQTEFSLNQYTSQLIFRIYPTNATNNINIKRVEMVSAGDEALQIPVAVRFVTRDGQTPVVDAEKTEYAEKAVLLFDAVVSDAGGAGGLPVAADTKKEDGVLGYMSMLPATYASGTYKFVVYFTETNTLKRVEINKDVDLVLQSNRPQPVSLEIDVNGAQEVTTGYDIYTETEFVSALTKSNAVTSGSSTFNLMKDIELNDSYSFISKTPVTFTGGKKISVANGKTLTFNANGKVVINNTIIGEGSVAVTKGEVEIDGVNSSNVALTNAGKLKITNANEAGNLANVSNTGTLTLKDATVAGAFDVKDQATATVDLENVTVGGAMTFAEAVTAESNLNNVNVTGNVTNNAATLNVKGTNTLAYEANMPTINDLTNYGTINFVKGATATAGDLVNGKTGTNGRINMGVDGSATTVTFKGTANLANGLVYIESKATMIADGELRGLKGDGTVDAAKSTMVLEGNLTTNKKVQNSKFTFCGKITNNGTWSLKSNTALAKFSHAHSSKASFTNNANGVVTVSGVTDKSATAAMNAMPRDLYSTRSKGTLVWAGITSMQNVDDIYKLGEGCWATQLSANLKSSNNASATEETLVDGVNWTEKDIVLNFTSGNTGAGSAYDIAVGKDKQIKAKNLTIYGDMDDLSAAHALNVTGGSADGVIVVEETMTLAAKVATSRKYTINIENGATCKNLIVNKETKNGTFEILKATKILYANTIDQQGYTESTVYPNGIPQKD